MVCLQSTHTEGKETRMSLRIASMAFIAVHMMLPSTIPEQDRRMLGQQGVLSRWPCATA